MPTLMLRSLQAMGVAVYLLACFYVLDKGLDLTDTGYHLSNQMSAGAMGFAYIGFMPPYWLSDVISACLSAAWGGWTLLEMRYVVVGIAFLQGVALWGLLRWQGMRLGVWETPIFTLVCLSMLAPLGFLLLIADYYALPVGLCYGVLAALILMGKSREWRAAGCGVLVAALLFLMLNMRLTTGVMLILLPIVLLVCRWILFARPSRDEMRAVAVLYGTLMVLMVAEYAVLGMQPEIWAEIASGYWRNDKVHSLGSIVRTYAVESVRAVVLFWPVLVGLVAYSLVGWRQGRFKTHLTWLPVWMGTTLLAGAVYAGVSRGFMDVLSSAQLVIGVYMLGAVVVAMLWRLDRVFLKQHAVFILACAAMPVAIFAGTNTGIAKLGYGMPFAVAAVLLMLVNLPERWRLLRMVAYAGMTVGLVIVVAKGLTHTYENIQIVSNSKLTYRMQHGLVAGTLTQPAAGRALDEMLAEVERRTGPEAQIFTFPAIPMVHFASGRRNAIGDIPNFDIIQPMAAIKSKIGRLCWTPETIPALIVYSRKYTFNGARDTAPDKVGPMPTGNDWGEADAAVAIGTLVEIQCRPGVVWQNDYYMLLEPAAAK